MLSASDEIKAIVGEIWPKAKVEFGDHITITNPVPYEPEAIAAADFRVVLARHGFTLLDEAEVDYEGKVYQLTYRPATVRENQRFAAYKSLLAQLPVDGYTVLKAHWYGHFFHVEVISRPLRIYGFSLTTHEYLVNLAVTFEFTLRNYTFYPGTVVGAGDASLTIAGQ